MIYAKDHKTCDMFDVQSSWSKTIEDVDGILAWAISEGIVAEAAGAFAQQAL